MAESTGTPKSSRAERFSQNTSSAALSKGRKESLEKEQDSIVAEILSVRIYGDWAVGQAWTPEGRHFKVTGASVKDLLEGGSYVFRGAEKNHRVHGTSFEVTSTSPYIAPNRLGVERYLERNFSGIGKVKAAEFVSQFIKSFVGDDPIENLRNKLLMEPWTLDLTGVSKKAEFKGKKEDATALEYVYRDFSTKLGGVPGMKDGILRLLARCFLGQIGDEEGTTVELSMSEKIAAAWTLLANDPYSAIAEVDGYGFAMADLIGRSLNIQPEAVQRLRALVAHAVDEGCVRSGHVYLYEGQVSRAIASLDSTIDASIAIKFALEANMIVAQGEGADKKFYTASLLRSEIGLARHIARLCAPSSPLAKAPYQAVALMAQEAAMAEWGYPLDPSQLAALAGIMTSEKRIHTLTAGPGCGKSALMELLSILLHKKSMMFVGPTGKSAKVLSGRVAKHGRSASTIHSAFQGADPDSFKVNKNEPLVQDVLVVDESSMCDIELMRAVLDGVGESTHVILLGDKNQLPSVSPGAVLRDLLSIKAIDRHELHTPHRNSGGILDLVNQVGAGKVACQNAEGVEFSESLGDASADFNSVALAYIEAVLDRGFENVVLLMSKRKGEVTVPGWNTTYANAKLRDACNPNAVKVPGTRLFVKDRIIVRKNLSVKDANGADAQIVNGDTGSILSWQKHEDGRNGGPQSLMLGLDDGRQIVLPSTEMDVLQHSYALTVHSAQGSEYRHVVAVVTPGSPAFINQAMLFTGLSRAKEALQIFGNDSEIKKVAMTPLPWRNSDLVVRACKLMGQDVPVEYIRQKGAGAWVGAHEPVGGPRAVERAGGSRAERFSGAKDREALESWGDSCDGDPDAVKAIGPIECKAVRPLSEVGEQIAPVEADALPKTVPLLALSGRTRSWPSARLMGGAAPVRFERNR